MLKSVFATQWDGNHVVVHWPDCQDPVAIRWRWWVDENWSAWIALSGLGNGGRHVFDTHREGALVQVSLQPVPGGQPDPDGEWFPAFHSPLAKVRGRFRFEASAPVMLRKGDLVAAILQDATAVFVMPETKGFTQGEVFETEMESSQASPFNELDRAGQFHSVGRPGLEVWNLGPTTRSMTPTSETEGRVEKLTPKGPFGVVFGQVALRGG